MSGPWRLSVVGSWVLKNTSSRSVVARLGRVVADLADLGVARQPRADVLVGGVLRTAARVARLDVECHAFSSLKNGLDTPKAARTECSYG